ncbi:MAG: hypothetical protein ACK5MV_02770 [Aminipila sp.]
MKVFLTFLSLFVLGIWCIVFQGDLGSYNHDSLLLKEAAQECAAGAATFIDEREFAQGRIVFDYNSGKLYVEDYLAYIIKNSKTLSEGKVTYSISFEDEMQGFHVANEEKIPAVFVKISVGNYTFFRLPFFKVSNLERSARYELPERT